MALLEVTDLQVHYGGIHALRGVSFAVEAGSIVTLIGANGAGKTTTLRGISGLLRPSGGSIKFDGRELRGLAPHKIAQLGIAHAPEGRGIFANMTVAENLELGAFMRHDKAAIARDRERVFAMFPRVRERLAQHAGTLSGGEQQMLAIARALLASPKLLLLDEPSLGLAPQITAKIFEIIAQIAAEGTTILLVEQNAYQALHVAQMAYVLEVGALAMSGPAAQLLGDEGVKKAYLGIHD